MKRRSSPLTEHLKSVDYFVLFSALGMTALGVLTLAGAANVLGTRYAILQAATAGAGLIAAFVISLFDYEEVVNRLWLPFSILSVGLIVAVILFGTSPDGSQNNWIAIPGVPFNIQPSEFVKITFVMVYAKHISVVRDRINKITSVIGLALHAGVIFGLLLISGDLGSALVYVAIAAVMLYAGGLSLWYFAAAALVIVVAFPYIWPHLDEYQQMRILCGFNPELDPVKYGYNAIMSRKAISAGGFRGAGLDGGTVWPQVPIAYADFLYCVLAEKLGFFGTAAYMVLMAVMIVRLIVLARRARKSMGSLIIMGFAAMMIAQAVENIGMCLAMLPVVGITLPFFSYGGSSMLSMYLSLGVIESIASHNVKYYFEREER